LLAELTDVMSDDVAQDLWILSIGIDNNPWGQYQPLIPMFSVCCVTTRHGWCPKRVLLHLVTGEA